MTFKKASKHGRWARISIQGPSGGGKTTTALRLARGLSPAGRIAVIDSEGGRSEVEDERIEGGFDVSILERARGEDFIREMRAAAKAGYGVIILDSISAEWEALLAEKDALPEKKKFTGWSVLTPKHDAFIKEINTYPGHVIATMRSKIRHEVQQVERNGRTVNQPVKLGMEPVARGGTEYEFDLAFELDHESNCWLNKRPRGAFGLTTGDSWKEPGEDLGRLIAERLGHVEAKPQTIQDAPDAQAAEKAEPRDAVIHPPDWSLAAARVMDEERAKLTEKTIEGFVFDGSPPASISAYFSPGAIAERGRDDAKAMLRLLREAADKQGSGS